jgi:hypothetical protein
LIDCGPKLKPTMAVVIGFVDQRVARDGIVQIPVVKGGDDRIWCALKTAC